MRLDKIVDFVVKSGVRAYAWTWKGDTYLGQPLKEPPKNADPVVMVNGFTVYNEVLSSGINSLKRDGFDVHVPKLPNNATDNIMDTAAFLRSYVNDVLRKTGAEKVDLVGFSEGGLIERAYIKYFGGDKVVDSAISVATPHNGVLFPKLGQAIDAVGLLRKNVPEAGRDMIKGSKFLTDLNKGDMTPGKGVRYTSIFSKDFDGIVWPASSPILPGAKNVALDKGQWFPGLRGPHHLGLQGSHDAYNAVRTALLEPRTAPKPAAVPAPKAPPVPARPAR